MVGIVTSWYAAPSKGGTKFLLTNKTQKLLLFLHHCVLIIVFHASLDLIKNYSFCNIYAVLYFYDNFAGIQLLSRVLFLGWGEGVGGRSSS